MIKTSTPELHLTLEPSPLQQAVHAATAEEPGHLVIQNILNFSRNLEVLPSKGMDHFLVIKS